MSNLSKFKDWRKFNFDEKIEYLISRSDRFEFKKEILKEETAKKMSDGHILKTLKDVLGSIDPDDLNQNQQEQYLGLILKYRPDMLEENLNE